jgi:NADH dehydrogenase (ubiquinone) 1 alpha subcomplex subunit 10
VFLEYGTQRPAMAHAISRGLPSKLRAGASLLQASRLEHWVPVATLIPTHGAKFDYAKPWNYKKIPFNTLRSTLFPLLCLVDYPRKRLTPNTKLIVVEGNIASGNNEFAEKLAKEFDLLYVPSVTERDVLAHPNGFDVRDLNDILDETKKFTDLKEFYGNPNMTNREVRVNCLQRSYFLRKVSMFANAMQHILNTGQGVVLTSSVFGDEAYTHALTQLGLIGDDYMHCYKNGLGAIYHQCPKPHVTIYLDSSVSDVKSKIKARNDPREVNSTVLNDKYIQNIEDGFKTVVLPKLQNHGSVLELEWGGKFDEHAFNDVVKELSSCDYDIEEGTERYKHWDMSWWKWQKYRRGFATMADSADLHLKFLVPWEAYQHPAIWYDKGWAPELGNRTLFKFF